MSEGFPKPHKVMIQNLQGDQFLIIMEWLNVNVLVDFWEHTTDDSKWPKIDDFFHFTLEEDAMLFKLTFGGK